MPEQERVCVGAVQEYPGAMTWYDYAVRCPECDQMSEQYGNVSTTIDGHEHYLCEPCGREFFPVAGQPKECRYTDNPWLDIGGEG